MCQFWSLPTWISVNESPRAYNWFVVVKLFAYLIAPVGSGFQTCHLELQTGLLASINQRDAPILEVHIPATRTSWMPGENSSESYRQNSVGFLFIAG